MSPGDFPTGIGLLLTVLVPLFGALLALALGRAWRGAGGAAALAAAALNLLLAGALFRAMTGPASVRVGTGAGAVPLFADGLALLLLAATAAVVFLITLSTLSGPEPGGGSGRFFGLLLIMLAGINGCLTAGDLFTLWVFMEAAGLAAMALVGFGAGSESLEAAFKGLVTGALGSLCLLFGLALALGALGTLEMGGLAGRIAAGGGAAGNPLLLLAGAFLLAGALLKIATFPFHAWMPDAAGAASAPAAALLAGPAVMAMGACAFIRIVAQVLDGGSLPGLGTTLAWLGTASMAAGALMAAGQWDLRRLLGFNAVSQAGCALAGVGLAMSLAGSPGPAAAMAAAGAVLHLAGQTVAHSLLALCAGAFERATGTTNLREMGGLWARMPATGASCVAGALSSSGVPPFAGFWSRLLIVWAAASSGRWALAAAMAACGLVTLAAFVKLQKHVLFGPAGARALRVSREAPWMERLAMLTLAAGCLLLGLLFLMPSGLREALGSAAQALTGGAGGLIGSPRP
ncbi:MAG TPA: proton-conducting transporter membrane subunit [Planctomycetota bacterium]|nr:proton-conducting transporter membrane subunit [Planctomycetota bacterium]